MRWKILMKPMGYQPALPNVFFAVMIGYLANLAVPRLGEVLKCTILARYEKVPADKLVGTILVERAFDVVCLGLVFLLAFGVEYEVVGQYARQLLGKAFPSGPGGYLLMKVLLGLVVMVLLARGAWVLLQQWKQKPWIAAVLGVVKGITDGLNSIRQLQEKGLFLLYSLGIWALYILGTWVGLQATMGTAGLGWTTAVSALAFASIGMIITPGGIGAYAFFLAKILALHEIPFELGMANGTLQWFAQFGIVLLVGFICLGLLPLYNKKNKHESHSSPTT
jgi:glycosyltransferase 2 family protein